MSNLSLEPTDVEVQSVTPADVVATAWFYEERRGINVVVELKSAEGFYVGTTQTLIPHDAMRSYLARRLP